MYNTFSSIPDAIPAMLVKQCAQTLVSPVATLFRKSINAGYFPRCWKMAYITPIFKNGDRHNVANYRPISLLNVFAKIFESLIKEKIMDRISHIFSCNQHAYLADRSTVLKLSLMDHVRSALDSGNQVDAIY